MRGPAGPAKWEDRSHKVVVRKSAESVNTFFPPSVHLGRRGVLFGQIDPLRFPVTSKLQAS